MNDQFLRACRLEPVDATPVWFMRQAGRSFAAYRALRERYGILELAKTPDLCAEVTLMPVRELGVDAAVLFADIMLPLQPMGVGVRIEPEIGPIIDAPIRSAADVEALRAFDPAEVSFTLDAIRLVRRELDGAAGVIGFSGAPFTLACYLIEGRPSRDFATAKAFMYREPAAWHAPDGAPHDDGRRLSAGAGRGRRGRRAAVRQLGRRARAGRLPGATSSRTSGGSSRRCPTCRRSTSGRAPPPCSRRWPTPGAT